jgi:hypothetical protein
LSLNTVLGPLVADSIRYPFSETMRNQTIGLEATSIAVVAPLCLVAAWLVARGHPAGPVLALGPAAYTAYMFVQYVVGPSYLVYPRVLVLDLGMFVLGGLTAIWAWRLVDVRTLPSLPADRARTASRVLLVLAAFTTSRYLPALVGSVSEARLPDELAHEPAMYWSIVLLDLGVVVPYLIGTAGALCRRSHHSTLALYAAVGWFALVPPSVAAMGVAMVVNDDPHRSVAQTVVFVAAAVVFAAYAVRLYRPLLRSAAAGDELVLEGEGGRRGA